MVAPCVTSLARSPTTAGRLSGRAVIEDRTLLGAGPAESRSFAVMFGVNEVAS